MNQVHNKESGKWSHGVGGIFPFFIIYSEEGKMAYWFKTQGLQV